MADRSDRRQECRRIIGVERRGAPIPTLEGRPLPDPTRLLDEDFIQVMEELDRQSGGGGATGQRDRITRQ